MIKNDAPRDANIAIDFDDDSYDRNICTKKLRKLNAIILRSIANAYDEFNANDDFDSDIENDISCALELIETINANITYNQSIEFIDALLNCDSFSNQMRNDDLIKYDCIHDLYIEEIISYDDTRIQSIIPINSHIDCKNMNARTELNARDNI